MKLIAISQRVTIDTKFGERRDCLDQSWTKFLSACGLTPILVPNHCKTARSLCDSLPLTGLILTGGNDLSAYGGDAPERDATENTLVDFAEARALPVLGVCRGMQLIQHRFGVHLRRVSGHVASRQTIYSDGEMLEVNSYHNFGSTETCDPLQAWAYAEDGIIEAVRHRNKKMIGIMWHPERLRPFAARDISFFERFFGSE
jgi:N5-(cytidine 5'-diphosphoramidyl)-L-glutamine hydrolase